MTRTISFTGARGGHGTTTVAAAVALQAARHAPTILVAADTSAAAALLGLPAPSPGETVEVTASLTLAGFGAARPEGASTVVVDRGRLASGPSIGDDGEHYLVLRGPCYLALATVLAAGPLDVDGVVLVAEAHRSLRPADVTDVLGVPVVATVTVSPTVARAIDAGLLPTRLPRLRDLAALRALDEQRPPTCQRPRTPSESRTDLPLSATPTTALRSRAVKIVATSPSERPVGQVWTPATRHPGGVEHRSARSRRGRLLRR